MSMIYSSTCCNSVTIGSTYNRVSGSSVSSSGSASFHLPAGATKSDTDLLTLSKEGQTVQLKLQYQYAGQTFEYENNDGLMKTQWIYPEEPTEYVQADGTKAAWLVPELKFVPTKDTSAAQSWGFDFGASPGLIVRHTDGMVTGSATGLVRCRGRSTFCGTVGLESEASTVSLLGSTFGSSPSSGMMTKVLRSPWGKVTFSDGTPLHGGTIVWTMEGTSRTTGVDKEGNYRLDLMKPGKYAVSFTGEATTLIDPKYLEADTSGLRITLDKANPFVGNKEQNVDFSVEQIIIIPGEDTLSFVRGTLDHAAERKINHCSLNVEPRRKII